MTELSKNTELQQSCITAVTSSAVLLGDCLELMKDIPDGSIDMILCDLPYGTTACKWDVIIPFDKLWQQYNRIIKDNGAMVFTSAQPFTSHLIMSNIDNYRYDFIWEKDNGTGFAISKKQPLRKHEVISVFYKKQPFYNSVGVKYTSRKIIKRGDNTKSETTNNDSKHLKESFYTHSTKHSLIKIDRDKIKIHPTQKPVALFKNLILTYTNEGETVLDNTAGSGTTAIACLDTNRNYILMEKEKKYFDIINERIDKHNKLREGELNFDAVS